MSGAAPDPPSIPSVLPTPAQGRSAVWIDGPWVDLLVGCGGWSLPLLLVSYLLVDRDVSRWSTVFYALALACNYPHYMATIYRAYGRDDRGRHRLFTHYLTAALVVIGVAAHIRFALVPWLFTAYVMWSPWHYTGQNFGLLMMFLRRAGLDVSRAERQGLHLAFVASFVMLLAAFNQGPSHDPLVLSIGLPAIARAGNRGRRRRCVRDRRRTGAGLARPARAAWRADRAAHALLDAGAVVRRADAPSAGPRRWPRRKPATAPGCSRSCTRRSTSG